MREVDRRRLDLPIVNWSRTTTDEAGSLFGGLQINDACGRGRNDPLAYEQKRREGGGEREKKFQAYSFEGCSVVGGKGGCAFHVSEEGEASWIGGKGKAWRCRFSCNRGSGKPEG